MVRLYFFTLIGFVLLACTASESKDYTGYPQMGKPVSPGEEVYLQNCIQCHGKDGKLGFAGATNLKKSELSLEQRIEVISFGRNRMQAFDTVLNPTEIQVVAGYLDSLKQGD